MTADVINLRRARKARAREAASVAADANRLAFGRSKAEREAASVESRRQDRLLDGVRREDS